MEEPKRYNVVPKTAVHLERLDHPPRALLIVEGPKNRKLKKKHLVQNTKNKYFRVKKPTGIKMTRIFRRPLMSATNKR
jgi:hypothetical protein